MRVFAIACRRCMWERSALGIDGGALLHVALRAHYDVWHPDAAAPTETPLEQTPPSRRRSATARGASDTERAPAASSL